MTRTAIVTRAALVVTFASAIAVFADQGKFAVKLAESGLSKDVKESFAKQLAPTSYAVQDDSGRTIAEAWFCRELSSKATAVQIKNGLTYRELEETSLLGVIHFKQEFSDFREQKVKAGWYSLRLGFQPMDGDHMGVSTYTEFALIVPLSEDAKPGLLKDTKELQELSTKASGGSHPAVMMLFPNPKPNDPPSIADKGKGQWVLNVGIPVAAGNQKTTIGLGLAFAGKAE